MDRDALSRTLALSICLALAAPAATASDWRQYRGPGARGTSPEDLSADGGDLGLRVAWSEPLGSGYSGVVIADGRAYTMFSSGDSDGDSPVVPPITRPSLPDATSRVASSRARA